MIEPGTPIAVVAPCGAYNVERFEQGLAILRGWGHDLRPLPGNLQPDRYLAAPDEVRLAQLVEAWTDPAYGAVWVARGGYGLTRLLDDLPWGALPDRPILGFSDVTALFCGMHRRGIGTAVHAPVIHSLPGTDEASLEALRGMLSGETPALTGRTAVEGVVEAPVVGGNLCLLAATAGTTHQLQAHDQIVVIEEVGEYAYRIDRMLQQVIAAGVLDGAVGVAVGELVDCRMPPGADYTAEDIVLEHLERLGIPVVVDVPVGHGARNVPFVWGQTMRLDAGLQPVTGRA